MSYDNRNNAPNNDMAGVIISWVITFILMFAFPPAGIIMLLIKLRGYARSSGNHDNRTNAQAHDSARRSANQNQSHYSTQNQAQGTAQYPAQAAAQYTQSTMQRTPQYPVNEKQVAADTYSYGDRGYPQTSAARPGKRKRRTALEKKTGKFISTVILLVSIALLMIGVNTLIGAARNYPPGSVNSWVDLGLGIFYVTGAVVAFCSRNIGVNRLVRYKKYYAYVYGRGIVPVTEIARACGISTRVVVRELQIMINEGYFGPGVYIDSELDSLVLYPKAAKDAREAAKYAGAAQETPPAQSEAPVNQYMAIILELRALNETILDIPISDKIDRIEELTGKIFRIVEDDPSKLPQIRRFMNYYLPTTLKLLRSYATLEKQGIKGENITAAKENIGRILDTLATGYEQQLDQLFESDAIDIAADINVLENLMQQDGLTGDSQIMKTMEGSM